MRKEVNKKHRINFIDILVILLALICCGSIVYRAMVVTEANSPKEYHIKFHIEDIKNSSFAFFDAHKGEKVRMIVDEKEFLGVLGSDFSRGAAIHTYTESGEDGIAVEKEALHPAPERDELQYEDRCSISGYIVVSGNMINEKLYLDKENFFVIGQEVNISTEYIKATITITGIEEK